MRAYFADAVIKGAGLIMASSFWIDAIPEHVPLVAVSGLAGGICRAFAVREKIWPNGASSVIVGCLVATFMWPVAEPFFAPAIGNLNIDGDVQVMFGGFVTGLLGMSLIGFFLDVFQRHKEGRTNDQE